MPDESARLDASQVSASRDSFAAHGHAGRVLVVDDQLDEAIFLVAAGSLAALDIESLCIEVQGKLGRKVWVVEESAAWRGRGRPLW